MSDGLRTPVIAGNWKLHKGPRATREFCEAIGEHLPADGDNTLIIFPPAISLTTAVETLTAAPASARIGVGCQNIHWETKGALTGEVSAAMAREAGAAFVLVGHSERRHIFGETDQETNRKMRAALEDGLRPVLCVGETREEREAGELEEVITRQLEAGLEGLDEGQLARVIIAYEPVWAIGTGLTATPDDAAEAHAILRKRLAELGGTRLADGVPILYGGSVRPENAADLCAAKDVDGLLVGGASLEPESFAAIAIAASGAHH